MKRRFFLVRSLTAAAALSVAGTPVLARAGTTPARVVAVRVRRHLGMGAVPGGCSTFRRRSPHAALTLADMLSGSPRNFS